MNKLKIINNNGKIKIMLDNFEVKCVENYEVKSSSTTGIAELTIKMLLKMQKKSYYLIELAFSSQIIAFQKKSTIV